MQTGPGLREEDTSAGQCTAVTESNVDEQEKWGSEEDGEDQDVSAQDLGLHEQF